MKQITNTRVDDLALLDIEDSTIENSELKGVSTVRISKNSEISLAMFYRGLNLIKHSNLYMVWAAGETLACRDAKITNCSFYGYNRIIDCEISNSTLCDIDIFGIHCYYTVKPGKDIYVPIKFSDYEFNLKDGELDITFRNPSKVWRFNKMSLAEFLKKYWK